MRFRILGPLEVWTDGKWQSITAEKWRLLLACLLLRAGQVVSTDTLIDELWQDDPPANPKNLISIYVLRLRRLLGDPDGRLLAYRAPGYVLNVADGDIDAARFASLASEGRQALDDGDPVRAAALLSAALGLWRGAYLEDVPPSLIITTYKERADEHRLAASEVWAQAAVASDQGDKAITELRGLVVEHPLREGLWQLLVSALEAAGRHAEALEAYSQARETIADQLGVDPGPGLRNLYASLLAADTAVASPVTAAPAARPPGPARAAAEDVQADAIPEDIPGRISVGSFAAPGATAEGGPAVPPAEPPARALADPAMPPPGQLPADIGDFTGREWQVGHLCEMLTSRGGGGPGAVPIVFVAGAGGLGKTTLAVHAAHQVRGQFPDGQLYADLLGATPQPLPAADVLARFLRDLGVAGDKIPAGDEERAALFRTTLTGRRVLVVLDNAQDTAQVRPLLPGSASCAVLVTTRNRTADLASTRYVDLNVLSDDEALTLFTRILGEGDERPAAEPEATAEVLLACAGLPLAIRICAARLMVRGRWKIATLASRLRDEQRRLDELTTGDLAVRACFQVSYDSLRKPRHGADPARAFRLLGLWQGPSVSIHAAAALLGEPEPDVAEALESLVDGNLLEPSDPDWYRFHDLLRFYATERARAEEPRQERAAAVARLLGWYSRTADAAAQAVAPHRYRVPDGDPAAPAALPVSSLEEALGWYDSERENLVAAARQAAAAGLHDIAWRLPATLFPLFNRRRNIADCVTATRIAVASARVAGHRQGEAWALQNLGQALAKIGDSEALGTLEQALEIRREIADHTGEAQTAVSLADAYHKIQGAEVAYEFSLRSLEIVRKAGSASLLGMGLVNHGEYAAELGRLDEAAACFREAYDLWRDIGGYGEGWALHNLGHVHLLSGQLDEAITCLTGAYRIHQASGDLIAQATTLNYLRQAHQAAGDHAAATEARDTALTILEGLKHDADVAGLYASIVSAPA